jgi:O-antigen ligase
MGGNVETRQRRLSSLLILPLFLLLALTYSRAAWLGFVAGLVILVLYQRTTLSPRHILTGLFLVMIVVIGAQLVAPELFSTVAQRFNPEETAGSDELHAQFIMDASQLWPDRPVFGYGVGNHEVLTGILHAHNAYATVLVEGGLVFLMLTLAWMASVVLAGHRAVVHSKSGPIGIHSLAVGLLAAYVSFLVDNLFQVTWYLGVFWLVAGLITALSFMVNSPSDNGSANLSRSNYGSQRT